MTINMRECEVDDCDRRPHAKGVCSRHYQRMRNHGSFEDPRRSQEERFWSRVEKGEGCWRWTGGTDSHGYGATKVEGRQVGAHRAAYEYAVGPIPEGMHLDHQCHNRDATCSGGKSCRHRQCVNPGHLEPIEPTVNQFLSGLSPVARNARKTHCLRGHEFTPENTKMWAGRRICITCKSLPKK